MNRLIALALLLSACAGPSQGALARTPIANTKANPSVAPAASTSDSDREELVKANDSMRDGQEAHREASQESAKPLKPLPQSKSGGSGPTTPNPPPASSIAPGS